MKRATLRTHRIIRAVCSLIIIGCVFVALRFVNFAALFDNINAQGYDPSQELAELIQHLGLTQKGDRILRGTRPELQQADDFNNSCVRRDGKIIILGCYVNNRVFVYNINDQDDLRGVREATLAHELLHAIWARMSSDEKAEIMPALDSVYENNEDLKKHLKLYKSTEYYDELHSIVGSQIPNDQLPEALKVHFAKYFVDQNVVANYYHQYSDNLATIEKRLVELEEIIKEKKADFEARTQKYNAENEQLSEDVLAFNSRANRGLVVGEEYDAERAELTRRQEALRQEYDQIKADLDSYNAYIAEYNKYVNFTNKAYKSMDSNSVGPSED